MLVYDSNRTHALVDRIVFHGNRLRILLIGYFILVFAVLLSALGIFVTPDFWWLGLPLGVIIGYGVGAYTASIAITVVEAIAQLLVAHDQLLSK